MIDNEDTKPDTLQAILAECKAAREAADRAYAEAHKAREEAVSARVAAEKAAAEALKKVQEKHDLISPIQALRLRVDVLELERLPLRAPWLALVLCTLNMVATLLLAWKVFR